MRQKVLVSWINENKTKLHTSELGVRCGQRLKCGELRVAQLLIAPSAQNFSSALHPQFFTTQLGKIQLYYNFSYI